MKESKFFTTIEFSESFRVALAFFHAFRHGRLGKKHNELLISEKLPNWCVTGDGTWPGAIVSKLKATPVLECCERGVKDNETVIARREVYFYLGGENPEHYATVFLECVEKTHGREKYQGWRVYKCAVQDVFGKVEAPKYPDSPDEWWTLDFSKYPWRICCMDPFLERLGWGA